MAHGPFSDRCRVRGVAEAFHKRLRRLPNHSDVSEYLHRYRGPVYSYLLDSTAGNGNTQRKYTDKILGGFEATGSLSMLVGLLVRSFGRLLVPEEF